MKKSDVIGFGIVILLCVWMVTTVLTFCYNPLLGVAIGVGGWFGLKKLS
jgi:hypothetical protein